MCRPRSVLVNAGVRATYPILGPQSSFTAARTCAPLVGYRNCRMGRADEPARRVLLRYGTESGSVIGYKPAITSNVPNARRRQPSKKYQNANILERAWRLFGAPKKTNGRSHTGTLSKNRDASRTTRPIRNTNESPIPTCRKPIIKNSGFGDANSKANIPGSPLAYRSARLWGRTIHNGRVLTVRVFRTRLRETFYEIIDQLRAYLDVWLKLLRGPCPCRCYRNMGSPRSTRSTTSHLQGGLRVSVHTTLHFLRST